MSNSDAYHAQRRCTPPPEAPGVLYDEPESGQRDGRQIPRLPRVAWLERPELPEIDIQHEKRGGEGGCSDRLSYGLSRCSPEEPFRAL